MHRRVLHIFLGLFLSVEASHGFKTPAAEISFIIPIPQPHPSQQKNPLKNMTRDTMIYMLTTFINPLEGSLRIVENPPSEGKDWGVIPESAVMPEALENFKFASGTDSPLVAFQAFRSLLGSYTYLKSRRSYHSRFPVPDTLPELQNLYQFNRWEKQTIELSAVKGAQRIIYRSPKSFHPISIAQTKLANNSIRETEIIIAREDLSEHFDFFTYNEKGELTQTSLFYSQNGKNVLAAVPYTCLTCHYDGKSGLFQTLPSSYTPRKRR